MRRLYVFLLGLATMALLGAAAATATLTPGPFIYPGKSFTTDQLQLLEVDRLNSADDYKLLFGPHPDSTDPVTWVIDQDAAGNWQVTLSGEGFIYMVGIRPYGGTDGGSATSDGSIIIIERTKNASGTVVHRFYYLHRSDPLHKMTVQNKRPASNMQDGAGVPQYVEKVGATGTLSDPMDLLAAGAEDELAFAQQVIDIAEVNGLDVPPAF
jgi:hypothetical protein